MEKPKMKISAKTCREVFEHVNGDLKTCGKVRLSWICKDFGYDPFIMLKYRNGDTAPAYDMPIWYNINDFGEVFARCFEVDSGQHLVSVNK